MFDHDLKELFERAKNALSLGWGEISLQKYMCHDVHIEYVDVEMTDNLLFTPIPARGSKKFFLLLSCYEHVSFVSRGGFVVYVDNEEVAREHTEEDAEDTIEQLCDCYNVDRDDLNYEIKIDEPELSKNYGDGEWMSII